MFQRIAIILIILCGCLWISDAFKSSDESIDLDDENGNFETLEEKQYALWTDPYISFLMSEEYESAYAFCSKRMKQHLSLNKFIENQKKIRKKFGHPLKFEIASVITDKEQLAGPNFEIEGEKDLDKAIRKLIALETVGELSDEIPLDLRRASVKVDMLMEHESIPKEIWSEEDPEYEIEIYAYLTVVLVEEDSELKIGHTWMRWPNILD